MNISGLRVTLLFSVSIGFMFLAVFPGSGRCAGLTPLELAQKLQARYEETKTMTADFKQLTSVPMSTRKRLGAGKLVISKPGRIRWDYQTPDKQVLISDGKKVSMYLANSAQLVVQPVSQYINSDVTYAFFVGTGNIVRDFSVLPPERQGDANLKAIKLVPKTAHPQVDYLHLWIDENFMVRRLEIVDHFGSISDLSFSNIRRNESVSPEVFVFTPPLGTEIIEQ
ncbi:MAG: outer membrane lipoprotein chaperone LolA [Desulfobulbaceae bacterium]|nr:outer membrane lipoprotein chaperone LolA [Desulfobulbaceae bacterium]HIJ89823.1 outer membrane lipoprotein chaperone LolA [Deltaproteobacteria bacterium]